MVVSKGEDRALAGAGQVPVDGLQSSPDVFARLPAGMDAYDRWIAATEPDESELEEQRVASRDFATRPVISVIACFSDKTRESIGATIDSVVRQTYERWELFLATSESRSGELRNILTGSLRQDGRLRSYFLDGALRVTSGVNDAAHLATGEFVVVLDRGGVLAPNALFEAVSHVNVDANVDLIYFDEDEVGADGIGRAKPFFKPDWSPELLLSTNYLSNALIRRSLFRKLDGFDRRMGEAAAWDFMLRCVQTTRAVAHIPKILFHGMARRDGDLSPGSSTAKAQMQSVVTHLQREGVSQAQARVHCGHIRLTWPAGTPRVSIVIPSRDRVDLLSRCLNTLLGLTSYSNYDVLVVDNNSEEAVTRGYYASLAAEPRVRILDFPGSFNYSAANNLGVRHSTGDLLLFLNNDTEILECDWLEEMVRWAQRPGVGAVGAKLLFPDGTIQHAGVVVGMGLADHVFSRAPEAEFGPFGSTYWYRNYLAVTGACVMMRRDVFDAIGGFDERYELVFSDVDLCLRAVAHGYRNVYTPFARLRHHESASRERTNPIWDNLRGYEALHAFVEGADPYYNPNLSRSARIPRVETRDEEYVVKLRRHLGLQ